MSDRTPQQIADQLNSLRAQSVSIVEGTIAGAANPGGSITFTYVNPIDGQPYTATGTAFNQCSPSKVSALKLEDGSWIVVGAHEAAIVREAVHTDRRARPKPESGGKIKILYSVIEGDQRVLYLWGDRPRPKRIASVPLLDVYVNAFQYFVSNQGGGNKYVVSLLRQDLGEYAMQGSLNTYSGRVHVQSFGSQVCEYILPLRSTGFSYDDRYLGHGFWSGNQVLDASYIGNSLPLGTVYHPSSYTLYQGVTTNYQGNLSFTSRPDQFGGQYVNSETFTLPVGISPSIVKTSASYAQDLGSAATLRGTFFNPLLLSQDAQSAIYLETTIPFPAQKKFVTPTSEVVLGGDIRPLPADANLIGSHLYQVIIPNNYNDSQWSVSIYELGTSTIKQTIKAKVQYKHSPNYQIHSASYHP